MPCPTPMKSIWAGLFAKKKPFFVGGRSIQELNKTPLKRCQVGFVVNDANAPIPLESHLVLDGDRMTGRVTSCNHSPTLGKPIGLAYVQPHCAEPGSQIKIKSSGGVMVTADIVTLPFYDPKTLRQEL